MTRLLPVLAVVLMVGCGSKSVEGDAASDSYEDLHESMDIQEEDVEPDLANLDSDDDGLSDALEIGDDPEFPVDFDGDTTPDYLDTDSDDDTISDRHETAFTDEDDTDGDTLPDRHDLDSDSDGLLDSEEAGDGDLETPPVDTDGDYLHDFQDPDSDNDGLSDADEMVLGTDPRNEDSDGDGVPDLIEVHLGTNPLDAADNLRTRYPVRFLMFYNDPADPLVPPFDPDPIMDTLVTFSDSRTEIMDISTVLRDDPDDDLDATVFVDRIEPNVVGGYEHPEHSGQFCMGGHEVADTSGDTVPDTFSSVAPTTTTQCFDIHPVLNDSVPPIADPQFFILYVDVVGNGVTVLETIEVLFMVPPDPEGHLP